VVDGWDVEERLDVDALVAARRRGRLVRFFDVVLVPVNADEGAVARVPVLVAVVAVVAAAWPPASSTVKAPVPTAAPTPMRVVICRTRRRLRSRTAALRRRAESGPAVWW